MTSDSNSTKKSNRNPVKQFFITFPKSQIDKLSFRDCLLRFDPDYYKIAEEHHKDGTPHLHAVMRTKNSYTKKFLIDHFKTIYPEDYKRIDVETVRSIKQALKYLSKEDVSPLESGEFTETRTPSQNVALSIRNRFAQEQGYESFQAFLNYHQERQLLLQKTKAKLCSFFEDISYVTGLPYELTVKERCMFLPYPLQTTVFIILDLFYLTKTLPKNDILKDDITKIMKELKIK